MFLAVDPGLRKVGLALFETDGTLRRCGLATGVLGIVQDQGPEVWRDTVEAVVAWVGDAPLIKIVSEYPKVYNVRNTDPHHLLLLASVVGGIALAFPDVPMQTVLPSQWKQQRSKDATTSQARRVMSLEELEVVRKGLTLVSTSCHHDVWDAVALGLVRLNRMR